MSSRSSSLARFASPTRSSVARARTQAPSPAAGAGMPARGKALQPGDEQAASSGAVAALLKHLQDAHGATALLALPLAPRSSPTTAGPPDPAQTSRFSLAADRTSTGRHDIDRRLSKLLGPCVCCNVLCTSLAGCMCREQHVP